MRCFHLVSGTEYIHGKWSDLIEDDHISQVSSLEFVKPQIPDKAHLTFHGFDLQFYCGCVKFICLYIIHSSIHSAEAEMSNSDREHMSHIKSKVFNIKVC